MYAANVFIYQKLYVFVEVQFVNPNFLEELSFCSYIKCHHLSETLLFLQNKVNNRGMLIFH